jgi:hypothetical protein
MTNEKSTIKIKQKTNTFQGDNKENQINPLKE